MYEKLVEYKARKSFELILAILTGVFSEIYFGWKWLYIIIGIYSYFRIASLHKRLSDLPLEMLLDEENLQKISSIENITTREIHENRVKANFVLSRCFKQFIITFLVIATISTIVKLSLSLVLSSKIWLILYILNGIFVLVIVLKRIWKI